MEIRVIIFFLIINIPAYSNQKIEEFFKETDLFLNKYVENGKVAYKAIKANLPQVEHLYNQIGSMDVSGKSDAEKKAFYMNAYNVIVIYQVVKYYPLKSPLDRSGFFDKVKHKVAGEHMTLNYLEIKKIILPFKDARIHFGLACAAISCPPLSDKAFMPPTIDHQLQKLTLDAINDKEFIRIDDRNNTVAISKIFDWYKNDFTSEGNTVLEYINKYRNNKIPTDYKVSYYEYDWSLNEE